MMALIQHSVGSRLFSPELLAIHLAFYRRLATPVPAYTPTFPRDWSSLPKLGSVLRSELVRSKYYRRSCPLAAQQSYAGQEEGAFTCYCKDILLK